MESQDPGWPLGLRPCRAPVVPEADRIAKIIHQTFSTRSLRPELRENVERIAAMNPGWEHRFYDDADVDRFLADNYAPAIRACFHRLNPLYGAAKADLFRYLALYRCGGVYLDIKSAASRAFDEVIAPSDRFLLSQWRNKRGEEFEGWGLHDYLGDTGGEFQQWFIVATAGHPFLRAVIDKVLRNICRYNPAVHGVGQLGVLRLTGPIAYSAAIAPILDRHPHRFVDSQADLGLDYSIYGNLRHKAVLGTHYSELSEPTAHVGVVTRVLARVIEALKPAIAALRRRVPARAYPRSHQSRYQPEPD